MEDAQPTDSDSLTLLDTETIPRLSFSNGMPLGGQVYRYLRELLRREVLKPGASVQTAALANQLGVSKTPLRDALIQLQTEGFLNILPQRGVVISTLDERALKEIVEVLGGLESKLISVTMPRITTRHIDEMREINKQLFDLLPEGKAAYRSYNKLNIAFHDVFVRLCDNELMVHQIRNLKERMYHFPDRDYGDAWRRMNAEEHEQIIELIELGATQDVADFMRDIHWSFNLKKRGLRATNLVRLSAKAPLPETGS